MVHVRNGHLIGIISCISPNFIQLSCIHPSSRNSPIVVFQLTVPFSIVG